MFLNRIESINRIELRNMISSFLEKEKGNIVAINMLQYPEF